MKDKIFKRLVELEKFYEVLEKWIVHHVQQEWLVDPKKPLSLKGDFLTYEQAQNKLKKLRIKIVKTKLFLEKGVIPKKDKPSKVVELKLPPRGVIDDYRIGLNSKGNFSLYDSFKPNNTRVYFHSNCAGGSLVVSPRLEAKNQAAILALMYSRNYRLTGQKDGLVNYSTKIIKGTKLGSFLFQNSKSLITNSENHPLYLHVGEREVLVSFKRHALAQALKSYIISPGSGGKTELRSLRILEKELTPKLIEDILRLLPHNYLDLKLVKT